MNIVAINVSNGNGAALASGLTAAGSDRSALVVELRAAGLSGPS